MFKRIGLLIVVWFALPILAQSFQPAINTLGFRDTDGQIEWTIEVSNPSEVIGTDIQIVSRLPAGLEIASVSASKGIVNIDNAIITIEYPSLQPAEKMLITITTNITNGANHRNSVCLYASNLSTPDCVNATTINQLPPTGESPEWHDAIMTTTFVLLLAFSVSIGLRAATAFYAR